MSNSSEKNKVWLNLRFWGFLREEEENEEENGTLTMREEKAVARSY